MGAAVSPACTIHKCCRMEWPEDESWLVLQHLSWVTALCSWDTSSASQNLCFNLTVLPHKLWDAVQRADIL